jgi:3-phytase
MKFPGILSLFSIVILLAASCTSSTKQENPLAEMIGSSVTPDGETFPVLSPDDAADDPAIFVNDENPSASYIIGTDKQASLELYYLNGMRRALFENGDINNADIRYGFPINEEERINIIGATDRFSNSVKIFTFNKQSEMLERIDNRKSRLLSTTHEIYGFCLYHDLKNDEFYGFVTTIDGGLQQWHLTPNDDNTVDGKVVRFINFSEQTEGCVADDETGYVYVAEEIFGIWKYPAHPDSIDSRGEVVDDVNNPNLSADIEGLTIYYAADGKGYLIASSQGNNSYAIYERQGNNRYLGSFNITDLVVDGEIVIDGTTDTDGIDVTNRSLGEEYPFGMFVVQDGSNITDEEPDNQNFKMVRWEKIANLFDPPLIIDTAYVVGQYVNN